MPRWLMVLALLAACGGTADSPNERVVCGDGWRNESEGWDFTVGGERCELACADNAPVNPTAARQTYEQYDGPSCNVLANSLGVSSCPTTFESDGRTGCCTIDSNEFPGHIAFLECE